MLLEVNSGSAFLSASVQNLSLPDFVYDSKQSTQTHGAIDLAFETKTDVQVQKISGEVML
jgi:hypothetical protein